MSEYRFVSFVPVAGEKLPIDFLCRHKNRPCNDDGFDTFEDEGDDVVTQELIDNFEFIRPADGESPAEPVTATIQATPAMTVREQFAMAAMQSLTLKGGFGFEAIALMAVSIADCTIRELAKPKVNE